MTLKHRPRHPIHEQIANLLREQIAKSRPGEQLDSESKFSRRFGVSVLSVREALSTLAHEGLVIRRHGSGTYVADRTAQQHVALMFGSHPLYSQSTYP